MKPVLVWPALALLLLFLPLVAATTQTLGTFPQDSIVALKQICANCTYVNFTSVQYQSLNLLENTNATRYGTEYVLDFTNTSRIGRYVANGVGDVDGVPTVFSYDFYITPSGADNPSSGQGLILIFSLFIIVIISGIFLFAGFSSQSVAGKVSMFSLSAIGFMVSVFYTMVMMTQYLGQNETIVSSYETFLYVLQMLSYIGIAVLFVVVALVLMKAWKIKRGLAD
jgi:hypothetical protein